MKPFFAFIPGADLRRRAKGYAAQGKTLNPLLDVVFKSLFGGNSEDSREALRSLLTSCLCQPVIGVKVLNTELLPEYLAGKTVRLDVHVTFNGGEQADLEIQINKTGDDFKTRALLYGSKLLCG
ncbi:MAG: Rpn family recombination-promoting nuclease/putative transposase, partial [Treponema sp.]|nr:Rpn family recombination-promoting nuclease/putative transposase [Treponema sp.]